MALTNAERQRAYRQRHLVDVEGSRARLNVVIDHDAALALRRLSAHKGQSQAETLARLIHAAQKRVTDRLSAEGWAEYHAVE